MIELVGEPLKPNLGRMEEAEEPLKPNLGRMEEAGEPPKPNLGRMEEAGEPPKPNLDRMRYWSYRLAVITCLAFITCFTAGVIIGYMLSNNKKDKVLLLIPNVDVIDFNPNNPRTYKEYTTLLDELTKPYETATIGGHVVSCATEPPKENEVCLFHAGWLDDCNKESGWGYRRSTPCVLLTFNKESSFEAEGYENLDQLPSDMPEELRSEIESLHSEDGIINEQIWVHCTGTKYYAPYQGFMLTSLHNKEFDEYLPPLVGVQFDLTKTDEIDVECGLWSNNTAVIKRSFKLRKSS